MKKLSHPQTRMAAMVVKLVETLREETSNPEIPAQLLTCFFSIAANRDAEYSITDLSERMGTSLASASRVVCLLGRGPRGTTGLGWVTTRECLHNRSVKRVALTSKGKALLAELENSLWPSAHLWLLGKRGEEFV